MGGQLRRVAVAVACVPLLAAPAVADSGPTPDAVRTSQTIDHATEATYRVTLTNLTSGQPFSPPVAATHDPRLRIFRVHRPASDKIAAIAQGGNQVPLADLLRGDRRVTQVVDVGRPLTPVGIVRGDFTSTVEFEVRARPFDRLSLATMLICTNDGLVGLASARLPYRGSVAYPVSGYDAGREKNTERSEDLVDPCSALGPAELAGDPNGNDDDTVATRDVIDRHPGITGDAQLDPALHGWQHPVAVVTITRTG